MITKQEAKILKGVIGNRFAGEVLKILSEFKIAKPDGSAYSDRYISHVLNGRYEHQGIEMAFWELRDRKMALGIEIQKLKNKKPEAVTPGSL